MAREIPELGTHSPIVYDDSKTILFLIDKDAPVVLPGYEMLTKEILADAVDGKVEQIVEIRYSSACKTFGPAMCEGMVNLRKISGPDSGSKLELVDFTALQGCSSLEDVCLGAETEFGNAGSVQLLMAETSSDPFEGTSVSKITMASADDWLDSDTQKAQARKAIEALAHAKTHIPSPLDPSTIPTENGFVQVDEIPEDMYSEKYNIGDYDEGNFCTEADQLARRLYESQIVAKHANVHADNVSTMPPELMLGKYYIVKDTEIKTTVATGRCGCGMNSYRHTYRKLKSTYYLSDKPGSVWQKIYSKCEDKTWSEHHCDIDPYS